MLVTMAIADFIFGIKILFATLNTEVLITMGHEQDDNDWTQSNELPVAPQYKAERNHSSTVDVNDEGLAYYECQDYGDLLTKYGNHLEGQSTWKTCFSHQHPPVITGLFVIFVLLGLSLLTVTVEKIKQDRAQNAPEFMSYFESSSVNLYGKGVAHYMLVDWQPTIISNNDDDDDDHASGFLIFDDVPDPRGYSFHAKTSSSFRGERGEGSTFTGVFSWNENISEYDSMDETNTLYKFFWKTVNDGRTVDLKIDDTNYDLMNGNIFLITTHNGQPAQVQQLSMDLSDSLPPYKVLENQDEIIVTDDEYYDYDDDDATYTSPAQASVQYLVDATPEIISYLQQVASYNQ